MACGRRQTALIACSGAAELPNMLDVVHGDPAPGHVGSAVFLAKAAVHVVRPIVVHFVVFCLHLAGGQDRW